MRIGIGYDIHRLTKGRKLILGGVKISHNKGLDGHSDADVLVHAVMDALLGAAAQKDIGRHFPNTDPKYKNADSLSLLKKVAKMVTSPLPSPSPARRRCCGRRGEGEGGGGNYIISNIDAMLIAEEPKLAPHIEKMRANIAKACGLKVDQVGVKATTNEGVGFIGRGEGIAAQAVVLLINSKSETPNPKQIRNPNVPNPK